MQPSIDVEVALRDGALDVGLFGPIEMMDDQTAEDLLVRLKEELFDLTRELES
jgi:hypothetical protein